jgi:uncharacterized protein YjiS (DUF1127 family)
MSMQKFTLDHPALVPASLREATSALARIVAPVSAGLAAIGRWRKRSLAAAELRALDDRLLQDIGLTRGQIDATLAGELADFDPELR